MQTDHPPSTSHAHDDEAVSLPRAPTPKTGTLIRLVAVILIVFVQLVQSFGDWLVRRLSHR